MPVERLSCFSLDYPGWEVALEKPERRVDILDRDRDVIETGSPVVYRRRSMRVVVGHLPELNQGAEGGPRRDEDRRVSVVKLLLVGDAHAVGLEFFDDRSEAIEFEREMMETAAVFADEAVYESVLPRRVVLDQLDRKAAEKKILPVEGAADLVAQRLGVAALDREVTLEERAGVIDTAYRDRDMIEPDAKILTYRHRQRLSFHNFGVKRPSSSRQLRQISGHPFQSLPP